MLIVGEVERLFRLTRDKLMKVPTLGHTQNSAKPRHG